jgi:hypothetical protein
MPRAKKFNGGIRKKKATKSQPRSNDNNGNRLVKKEVEKLPPDFPRLQPVAVAVQARPTRQCKVSTGARPTVENFSCVMCKEAKGDCQFETTTNHIYCGDCLDKYKPSTSWWDEGDDDDNLDAGGAFENDADVGTDVFLELSMDWEEVMEQLSDNAKLLPSKLGGYGTTSGSGFKVVSRYPKATSRSISIRRRRRCRNGRTKEGSPTNSCVLTGRPENWLPPKPTQLVPSSPLLQSQVLQSWMV